MSAATATSPPAPGWYPDPRGRDEHLRWWDGATWTNYATDPLEPESERGAPRPFSDFVGDFSDDWEDVPADDDIFADLEPIKFSWSDPADLFEVTVSEPPAEPDPTVPLLPVYESPLATISSPRSVRVEIPVRVEVPVIEPRPSVAAPRSVPAPAAPPAPPAAQPRRKVALAGTGAAVAIAATAALATNLITGGHAPTRAKAAPAAPALSATEKVCLKTWNTTGGAGAAQLRVTLGQFQGALAKVGRVKPLPGTVMAADSCALTVYDPSTDTNAVFVSGVQGQDGYLDVTSYPRAKAYGWPKTAHQANVTIRTDGTIRAS